MPVASAPALPLPSVPAASRHQHGSATVPFPRPLRSEARIPSQGHVVDSAHPSICQSGLRRLHIGQKSNQHAHCRLDRSTVPLSTFETVASLLGFRSSDTSQAQRSSPSQVSRARVACSPRLHWNHATSPPFVAFKLHGQEPCWQPPGLCSQFITIPGLRNNTRLFFATSAKKGSQMGPNLIDDVLDVRRASSRQEHGSVPRRCTRNPDLNGDIAPTSS